MLSIIKKYFQTIQMVFEQQKGNFLKRKRKIFTKKKLINKKLQKKKILQSKISSNNNKKKKKANQSETTSYWSFNKFHIRFEVHIST